MKRRNRWIMGSAIGIASIAIAIDHTRHSLPEPEAADISGAINQGEPDESPCSLDSPCSLNSSDSPCSLDNYSQQSPCSLESPCSLDSSPCSLD